MDQPFYIISNASKDIFPNNTLAEFKNVFPKTLSFKEHDKWEVGLEAVGLTSMFRNVFLPKPGVPSVYVGHQLDSSYKEMTIIDETQDWHKELYFNLDKTRGFGTWFELKDKYYTLGDIFSMCTVMNVRMKEFCLFDFDGKKLSVKYHDEYNKNAYGTWVLLHETFIKSFILEDTNF